MRRTISLTQVIFYVRGLFKRRSSDAGPTLFAVCLLLIGSLSIFPQSKNRRSPAAPKPAAAPTVVTRYIEAVKERNFRAVIDLTLTDQQAIAHIKGANPRALWPKLLDEYYAQRISTLTEPSNMWTDLARSANAMWGDPAQNLRTVLPLLPQSCSWSVSEIRNEQNVLDPAFGLYRRTSVYVLVSYPLDDSTPMISKRFLKQIMLHLSIYGGEQMNKAGASPGTGFVMNISAVGDTQRFWEKPYPKSASAFLIQKYRSDILTGDRDAVTELVELAGSEAAEGYLLEVLNSTQPRSPAFDVAAGALAARHVHHAVPAIVKALDGRNPWVEGTWAWPDKNLVAALKDIGKTEYSDDAVTVLIPRLSNLIGSLNYWDDLYQSVSLHLQALASVSDNPAWLSFPYQTGSACNSILNDLHEKWDASSAIDGDSPAVARTTAFLRDLQPCKGSRCPYRKFNLSSVKVIDVFSVEVRGDILEGIPLYGSPKKIGEFTMFVRRKVERPDRWLVSDMTRQGGGASTVSSTGRSAASQQVDNAGCNNASRCAANAESLLAKGEYIEAQRTWDRVLELGGKVTFLVCRETGFTGCKPGSFVLNTKEVSFSDGKGQQVFSAPLADLEIKGAQRALKDTVPYGPRPFARFRLKVSGKDYSFVFKPMYIRCTDTNPPTCDEPGLSQQETVANYVERKLQSLKMQ